MHDQTAIFTGHYCFQCKNLYPHEIYTRSSILYVNIPQSPLQVFFALLAASKECLLWRHIAVCQWPKSLLKRMNYVKQICSNAGKITQSCFTELKDLFLSDIKAEVLMNDIPSDFIIIWDQTGIQLSIGAWTLNCAGEKIMPIHNSDDKWQITAVIAATMTGKYLPIQLIYKGKTNWCHPKTTFPDDWDIFHRENHWSKKSMMKCYFESVLLPYI